MSLDVYLIGKSTEEETWCYCCGQKRIETVKERFFESNITHNLNKMAQAAGIYQHLWRPEELGITTANELIQPLKEGLNLLKALPEKFEQYNASNGWGLYKHFVPFVEEYLTACIENPEATIEVSR